MAWITADPNRNGMLDIIDPERPEGDRYVARQVPWADASALCALVNGQRLTYEATRDHIVNLEPF